MKTPNTTNTVGSVEEIVEQINAMLDGEIHEKCLYYTYSTLKDNIALLGQALTQAKAEERERIALSVREGEFAKVADSKWNEDNILGYKTAQEDIYDALWVKDKTKNEQEMYTL